MTDIPEIEERRNGYIVRMTADILDPEEEEKRRRRRYARLAGRTIDMFEML